MGRKKKKTDEERTPDLLQMMTVSLFIILLAFFIMLNAIAVVDDDRKRVALGSLMENFGILSGGYSVIEGEGNKITTTDTSKITSLIDFDDMTKDDEAVYEDLIITRERHRSKLSIPADRLFKADGTTLVPESHAMLGKLGAIILKNMYPVDVIGFVDASGGDAGRWASSREISALWALAVQGFLVESGRVPPKLVTAYGWGEYRSFATNRTRETRRMNRRVEVVFIHEGKQKEPEGFFTFKDFFFNVFDKK